MFDQTKIRCVWNDDLKGKMGVGADSVSGLQHALERRRFFKVKKSGDHDYPFKMGDCNYRYCYVCDAKQWVVVLDDFGLRVVDSDIDPKTEVARLDSEEAAHRFVCVNECNVDTIRAYLDGRPIECRWRDGVWTDCPNPCWWEDREYRVKQNTVTHRQLARWLARGNGEQIVLNGMDTVDIVNKLITSDRWVYTVLDADKSVPDTVRVRRWEDEEWVKPTVDYCKEQER